VNEEPLLKIWLCVTSVPDAQLIILQYAYTAILIFAGAVLDLPLCGGRSGARSYYKDFSETLSGDTIILTAGCAKYRYNRLDL